MKADYAVLVSLGAGERKYRVDLDAVPAKLELFQALVYSKSTDDAIWSSCEKSQLRWDRRGIKHTPWRDRERHTKTHPLRKHPPL